MAAISVAERVAEELSCAPGTTVAHAVRFDDQSKPGRTRIKYMTDGLLFREMMYDPRLTKYSVIMVDEAHERSLHTDIVLGLLKKVLVKRPELRVIIASATIDAKRFVEYFRIRGRTAGAVSGPSSPPGIAAKKDEPSVDNPSKEPAIIYIDGNGHELTVTHVMKPCGDRVAASVMAVKKIDKEHADEPGDILVFLPGKPEIDKATDLLTAEPDTRHLYPLALHGSLSTSAQMAVFQPAPRGFKRRVIFATNVAETSLTIPDIRFVIDSGLVKRRVFQPASGTDKMVLCRISKSSARQRAGRAGRTGPGRVFRLYTEDEYESMPEFSPSEMELCDFTSQLLQLKAIGIQDPVSFGFLTPPPRSHLEAAKLTLKALGALNHLDELTPDFGIPMAELPVESALGRMLMASKQYGCTANILNIVSMLSVGDIFHPGTEYEVKRKQAVEEGDLLTLHNIYLAFQQNRANAANWAPRHGLVYKNLEKAERLRALLAGHLRHHGMDTKTESGKDEPVLKCIFAGLFMNLAQCQSDGSYRLIRDQSPSPQALFMHPDSMLFRRIPDWVVFTEALQTTKMFIRNVSVVEKAWISEVASHYFNLTFR